MTGAPRHFLLFFIDGLGVGLDDPEINPLATGLFPSLSLTEARTPEAEVGPPGLAGGLDASMGVKGLPQSATGQTAILTGVNASAAMGHHMSGFPGPTLRKILLEHSILKRLLAAGASAEFANAFGPRFFERPEAERRMSATTLATLASGRPFRTWKDLLAGRAVVHDLTHWRMREWGYDLPLRTPEEAGEILARQCAPEGVARSFTLFEYFETDRAGHARDRERALHCLSDLDRAQACLAQRPDDDHPHHLAVIYNEHSHGQLLTGRRSPIGSILLDCADARRSRQQSDPGGLVDRGEAVLHLELAQDVSDVRLHRLT